MKNSLLTKLAREAYKKGDYKKSYNLYKEASEKFGKKFFEANLALCNKHILQKEERKSDNLEDENPDAENYVRENLKIFKKNNIFPECCETYPKVSIVVTAFNARDTVERSVRSLLMQNYPDLEVIVCDDVSTDDTWTVLQNLQKQSPKSLKIFRVNSNGGTYLAKNIAIAESSGEIILFQDSDDYSHPERVMIQVLPLIHNQKLIATRTKYLRFAPETKKVVPVASFLAKYGLITLAVRKKAFNEIGYFDAVRKAGDDEWFQRLSHLYGKESILNIDVALYLAELREGSLIADMLTFNQDGSVEQSSSAPRKEYVKIFKSRFNDKSKNKNWYKNNFPPYPLIANRQYPDSVHALENNKVKIFGNVCCIPSRLESFKKVVGRILPQVDELFVYLDKFDKTPDFLANNKKIKILLSQDTDFDYRDNAKFIQYSRLKSELDSFYYFTFDDDITYPYDYARSMIKRIEFYKRNVVVGVHGVVYEENVKKYFRRRIVYHFQDAHLTHPQLVNNLGTGTVAFHSDSIPEINVKEWDKSGMVDIFFANTCRKNGVPMMCIDRHSRWLMPQEESEDTPTLFGEFKEKESLIVSEIRKFPYWGYEAIRKTLESDHLSDLQLEALLPEFSDQVTIANTLQRFR